LPDDLRAPTFQCAYCKATIQTASVASAEVVSADALLGHMADAIANPSEDIAASVARAPKVVHGTAGFRDAQCKGCGAPVQVPLDVTVHRFECGGCKRTQFVDQYISDKERLDIDMARQVAGNQAFARLKAEGVPCGKCAGVNHVPDDGSVQVVCRFCSATILLTDHVDASAISRARLKQGVMEMRDEALRAQAEEQRNARVIAAVVFVVVALAIVATQALTGR
jgi:hypothetical protein